MINDSVISEPSINFPPVANVNYHNGYNIIMNFINDPVVTCTNTISVCTFYFLYLCSPEFTANDAMPSFMAGRCEGLIFAIFFNAYFSMTILYIENYFFLVFVVAKAFSKGTQLLFCFLASLYAFISSISSIISSIFLYRERGILYCNSFTLAINRHLFINAHK